MAKTRDNSGYGSGVIAEESAGIEIRSDDPTLSEGLVWYNTTANTLKVARNIGAWSTGGNLNTGRTEVNSGTNGTQTACFIAGGSASGGRTLNSETYDGSTWTSRGNMTGTARGGCSNFGTMTAGAAAGGWTGSVQTLTNEFNGASWADASAALATGSTAHGACGTQTAALSRVGSYNDVARGSSCEEYDGSSHSSGGALSGNRGDATTCGTLTSAVQAGGQSAGGASNILTICQTYNGSSWTTNSATLAGKRRQQAIFGASDSDATICGGNDNTVDLKTVESWNGTTWSSEEDLPAIIATMQGCGSSSGTGLISGGTSNSNATKEFSQTVTAQTITDS